MDSLNTILFIAGLALVIVMFSSTWGLLKRNKKNKKLVECVDCFDDEQQFFAKVNDFIQTIQDPEFETKGTILKIWGLVQYQREDEVLPLLDQCDFKTLIYKKGKIDKQTLSLNEDSFYYYNLACPNTLYAHGKLELLETMRDKFSIKEEMQDQLSYALSEANYLFYKKEKDLGESFLSGLIEGDYGQYTYSKQMIGIYKEIATTVLAKIYVDQGNTEKFESLVDDCKRFKQTRMGARILKELDLFNQIPDDQEPQEESAPESKEESKEEQK